LSHRPVRNFLFRPIASAKFAQSVWQRIHEGPILFQEDSAPEICA
jgi:hypothetical protein